ncbi:fasciclin domain-containing protein [Gillisia sp. Q332]|uniref:fasciclin domain-containing protein n=1 Tax=Gillisia xinjiangensis TaxID=3384765 RepID=UPI00391B0175
MKTRSFLFAYLIMAGTMLFVGCKEKPSEEVTSTDTEETTDAASNRGQAFIDDENSEPNALNTAINSPDHTTLVAAVQAAEVENALVNVGPLSVFAPTNAAFDKLPAGTLDDLLKPENKEKLANILINHVAPGNYPIETLKKNVEKGRTLYMASGEYVPVTQEGEDIYVGGTKILASINVSNGWVHIIEDIILPKN